MNDLIMLSFDGNKIAKSNYYESSYNAHDKFFMAYNAKCFHLFIPSALSDIIKEIKTGNYAVLTVGKDRIFRKNLVEIMFEDFTDNPYSITISPEQMLQVIGVTFNNLKFSLIIYTETGIGYEMDVYVRFGAHYKLPFLKPIDTDSFTVA